MQPLLSPFMTVPQVQFPSARGTPILLDVFPNLNAAWNCTRNTLAAIRSTLTADQLPAEVVTIYVCGSLGRMEQLDSSDCDLVIVTDDNIPPDSKRGAEIHALVWERIEQLDLHRPKPNGIFSQTVTRGQLTDRSALGIVDEDQFVFGKRIQILLDSQPLYRDAEFESLQRDVLQRSRYPHAELLQTSVWAGLRFDLIRYFRALCIRTMWLPDQSPGNWRVLNVKLRHSRLLLYAGLMALLDENDADILFSLLKLSPLERVLVRCPPDESKSILNAYDHFLQMMNNAAVLAELADEAVPIEQSGRAFQDLIGNSSALSVALSGLPVFQGRGFLREALFV